VPRSVVLLLSSSLNLFLFRIVHPDGVRSDADSMLVDTNKRDMSCTLKLGKSSWTFDGPLGFAPIGISKTRSTLSLDRHRTTSTSDSPTSRSDKIYHPLGELNAARVAGELNLPYCLSTAGSQPIADVASAHDDGARGVGREAKGRFFQLYWPHVRRSPSPSRRSPRRTQRC